MHDEPSKYDAQGPISYIFDKDPTYTLPIKGARETNIETATTVSDFRRPELLTANKLLRAPLEISKMCKKLDLAQGV